jgi:hypothetical protein
MHGTYIETMHIYLRVWVCHLLEFLNFRPATRVVAVLQKRLDTHVLRRFSRSQAAVGVKLTLPTARMNNAWRCTSAPLHSFLT